MNANLRNFALWVIIVLLLLALFTLFQNPGQRASSQDISFSQLLSEVDQGHVRGHQSILVRLPETGPVLLTIDAVPQQSAFTPDRQAGPFDEDEEVLRASTRKLLDLVQREQVKLVVFGHDGEQWQSLKKAPDYYR